MKLKSRVESGPLWYVAEVECDIRYVEGPEVFGFIYNKCWKSEEERDYVEAFMQGVHEVFEKSGLASGFGASATSIYKVEIFNIETGHTGAAQMTFKIAGIQVAQTFLGQEVKKYCLNKVTLL